MHHSRQYLHHAKKSNADDDDTPPLFQGSSFVPVKDVISREQDDPELVDYAYNDDLVLWHSTVIYIMVPEMIPVPKLGSYFFQLY